MPFRHDIRTVTVPGCVDGWVALHERFGTLPLATLLGPAIALAEDGFPASPLLVASAAMVDPVSGRCACATCGGGCHDTIKQPAAAGVCHKCGGTDFARRADDTAETLRARLQACHAQTAPLIAYCDRRGVLERIDAMGPIAEIGRTLPTIVARIAA
jgi:hypothetical protein